MNLAELAGVARNAWAISWLGAGIEAPHTTPTELLLDEPHARVERFAPSEGQTGNPVLLVTPLAVPVTCWDLRPTQSLAAHLAGIAATSQGARPTYTVDYGRITFADRRMGFEDWISGILPRAIRAISAAHGGADVHLVGWSHGGTMSLLTAAYDPSLPLASITALGTPTDYKLNPVYAPVFWSHERLGWHPLALGTSIFGGTTERGTRLGYKWMAPARELTKPWLLVKNLHRPEVLARISATDNFIGAMPAYPGRFFNQSLATIVAERSMAEGRVQFTPEVVVDMENLSTPTLLIASSADVLANPASVAAGLDAYPNAEVTFQKVKGLSHLGLIASPKASDLTWPLIDQQMSRHDR